MLGGFDTREAVIDNRGVETKTVKVSHGDAATHVTVCDLWEGDVLLDLVVTVTEAFNGGGTDLLEIGTTASHGAYLASTSIAATTSVIVASQAGSPLVPCKHVTADTQVVALYTDTNADSTAGECWITAIIARCILP